MRTLNALTALLLAPPGEGSPGGAFERLGTMAPIEATPGSGAAVVEALNTHRAALLELGNDLAKQREAGVRMQADLLPKLQAHRASARAEWIPGGDVGAMVARYWDVDAGHLRLGRRAVPAPVVDVTGDVVMGERVEEGFLTDPYPVHVAQQRAQEAYSRYALSRSLLKGRNPSQAAKLRKTVQGASREFFRSMMELPGEMGAWARSIFGEAANLRAAMSSTTGYGGELIANPTLANVVRPADIARKLVAQIPTIDAPSSTFKKPSMSGRVLMRQRQAISDDPQRFSVTTLTTSSTTLTLKKLVAQVLLDADFVQDEGLVLGDALGFIRALLAQGRADSLELMFLHGDTAGTHQDTLATWTLGSRYTAGVLAGTDSPLTAWLGLRAAAFDGSGGTVAGGGAFTATTHFNALNAMGANAAGARMAVGLPGLYSQLLSNALFTTVDKAGAAATLQSGQIGQIGDTPIDLTDFLAAEYASTGLYTGSGTTNTFVYYSPNGWRYYRNAMTAKEWDVTYPEKGAQYVGIEEEGLLDSSVASGERASAVIINL